VQICFVLFFLIKALFLAIAL